MVIISNLTKPAYFDLAKITNNREFSISRGRATDDFQRGIEAYDEENYNQAILFFNKDAKLNSSENTIFYTHYLLGLTYLESAQKSILGLFPHIDNDKVSNGIVNLKICIRENNSGEFQDINMNANYYLSKAYLMEGNKEEAILSLKNVINGKGSKMDEAAKILNKLE
jgi:tetratricopeptide (TPR) repeat protein